MFDRKSMEDIVSDMITWARGVTTKLTDFRVGSKTRTIMEAVAIVIEERTDALYRSIRELIETNIYAIFGFDKIPATYATGTVTFSRNNIADQNYIIPAGTAILSQATQYSAPIRFYTAQDAIIAMGTKTVNVSVVCEVSGSQGNVAAGSLNTFLQQPVGIDAVTNALDFITGAEEETAAAQKARFQLFQQAQSRGVLQSIVYGAQISTVNDPSTGVVTEKVVQAVASEDLVNKLGQIDLYIWNGAGTASAALVTSVTKTLTGYYDSNNNPIYGYKPAGVIVNVYSAAIKSVNIKLTVTPESWTTLTALQPLILSEVTRYFANLQLGQTVVRSALEANIKYIDGVNDVVLNLSTDNGVTYNQNNVTVTSTQIAVAQTPIVYA